MDDLFYPFANWQFADISRVGCKKGNDLNKNGLSYVFRVCGVGSTRWRTE